MREKKREVESERGSRLCAKVTTERGAVRHIAETGREPSLPEEVPDIKKERERKRRGDKREREIRQENKTKRKSGRKR